MTQQIKSFTTLGIGNAAAMALARKNKDFYRSDIELTERKVTAGEKARSDNGSFIRMSLMMRTRANVQRGHAAHRRQRGIVNYGSFG